MSDALDDLFGAFDDDDGPTVTSTSNSDGQDVDMETKSQPLSATTNPDQLPPAPLGKNKRKLLLSQTNSLLQSTPLPKKQRSVSFSAETKQSPDNASNPNVKISTGTADDKSINSYTALPPSYNASDNSDSQQQTPAAPAKTYPFTLDPFQQEAISYIDKNESVLVAAHTSAGKTAVAEYAVAKSLKQSSRVIYTSPIKALSNQKYRDLQAEFEDVGLMTGDITINPSAMCLVMTTEILRSMLYRGSEVMREVAWVIYDEVHYMRDKERGVVWEESIILLPHKVRFVFLSATIPNSRQFVGWIAKIHNQPCHVVYTNYRPVPLQHYIFPAGGEGLHLVVDEKGKFREDNFQRAMSTLQNVDTQNATNMLTSGGKGSKKKKKGKKELSDLNRIVKLVMERGLNPVIVFSFSKKECEKYALDLNKEDYNDDNEKDLVDLVYANAIDSLSNDDQKLPQVVALLPLLKRGIGVHHGGLLPILKEIVEILFSEGLIKCLFATETFSIGINMPAKTVIFTNCRKWDGKENRWVTSGEYIQMSGRAGRRGKDDRGIVIQMMDEKMEPKVCKGILYGDPDPLNSSYHISYNMLLNMMRVEDVDPEFLIKASFHQYQQESEAPALDNQALEFEADAGKIQVEGAEIIGQYYGLMRQLELANKSIMEIVLKPEFVLSHLQPGRLVRLQEGGEGDDRKVWGWGVVVCQRKKQGTGSGGQAGKDAAESDKPMWTIECIVRCRQSEEEKKEEKRSEELVGSWKVSDDDIPYEGSSGEEAAGWVAKVRTFELSSIQEISASKLKDFPEDTKLKQARKKVGKSLIRAALASKEGKMLLLDPIDDLKVTGDQIKVLLERVNKLTTAMVGHEVSKLTDEERRLRLGAYEEKNRLQESAKLMRKKSKAAQAMVMKDELRRMKKVLKYMGHVDSSGVVQLKGRTACEINTANELVATELTFGGIFAEFSVEQIVALLSCFTFDEKSKDNDGDPAKGLRPVLATPFKKLQEAARTVAQANKECKIYDLDEDEFVDQFNPGMMEAVYAWTKGAKFIDVQKLTDTYEGTTIRTLRRLEELVRQLSSAAQAVGNTEMYEKFIKGSELIKRDIVFCNSLYL
ncbi:hypothetical protein TrRE_jg13434 [Triparma retinervis]|uniref:ATP-dependent RNA helicase DOB1 n=1 Tax=Triparma retinervis TaxID=2557542 RepID=A0A9W7GA25_9STRA|nr:hypothetical protein TrRE_jg13434 [Triparma retinervis]